MDERYLAPFSGGRWAVSREVEGRWIHLVENAPLEHQEDAQAILRALEITPADIDTYFPLRGNIGRCPTLDLLELFSRIGEKIKAEVGV